MTTQWLACRRWVGLNCDGFLGPCVVVLRALFVLCQVAWVDLFSICQEVGSGLEVPFWVLGDQAQAVDLVGAA